MFVLGKKGESTKMKDLLKHIASHAAIIALIAYVHYFCHTYAASDAQGGIIFVGGIPLLVFLNIYLLQLARRLKSKLGRSITIVSVVALAVFQCLCASLIRDMCLFTYKYLQYGMNPYTFERFFTT